LFFLLKSEKIII